MGGAEWLNRVLGHRNIMSMGCFTDRHAGTNCQPLAHKSTGYPRTQAGWEAV